MADQVEPQVTMCTACAGMPVDQRPGVTDGTVTKDGLLLCVTHAAARDQRLLNGGTFH